MNEIERRFGWRLNEVVELIKRKNYEEAFSGYNRLVKLFNRLNGYDENEKIDFYRKIEFVGSDLLFKLYKERILGKIIEDKFSIYKFKERLKELTKENLDKEFFKLIKKEKFEEAIKKFYENR